jgi:endonuclease I
VKKLLALYFLLHTTLAFAEITNGDFEQWTGNTPDSWSTIDSGIQVTPSTTLSNTGSTSAAITVNTGTQGSTDFRQTMAVTQGETYHFSVAVFHTDGGVKARMYANGYFGYTDPTLTNQWQTLSHTYTATSTTSIEVGLRFYDVSGFDGSELVYIDSFLPSTATDPGNGGGNGGGSGACANETVNLVLVTDNYASETSWSLTEAALGLVSSGSGYANNTQIDESFCLVDGSYSFTINDDYGDGICCSYGQGSYILSSSTEVFGSGGDFNTQATHAFTIGTPDGGNGGGNGGGNTDIPAYYSSVSGLTGYPLKTGLYQLIQGHTTQGYGAIWTFYANSERDTYYENDGSLLDIYSENPTTGDPYTYLTTNDQCGNYNSEADCYNREHSFPRSWFGGSIEPMNSDIHHIFATDGYVNSKRGSFPYGEVGTASYTSSNGSKLGSAASSISFTGTVFEPIDEFKGDVARAHFYMATRYENSIASWEGNSTNSNSALAGNNSTVFEAWYLTMLKRWHTDDPVSQKEIDRNEAAQTYQGNRNPFVDYPGFVELIWGP